MSLFNEKYENLTDEGRIISRSFNQLNKPFIENLIKSYSSRELENILLSELLLIFAELRMQRNSDFIISDKRSQLKRAIELDKNNSFGIIEAMSEDGLTDYENLSNRDFSLRYKADSKTRKAVFKICLKYLN